MKKVLSAVILIFICHSSFSQDYKPLLNNLNEWKFTTCFSGCLTDVYYTDGDTLVDGKSYKILDGFHYISRTFLLREEIKNRKVFLKLVTPGHNQEFLLYDFSLNEGEIFNMRNPISPFPQDGGPFILDSIIPRILEDGNSYKHFYFSPTPENTISTENSVWIEGVGSLSLINAPGGKPDINEVGHLSCFFKNAEIFYSNLDSIKNCKPIHLEVEKYSLSAVKISKLNTENQCILSNTKNIEDIYVYDISGKALKSIKNKGKNSIPIDLSKYNKGLYIIMVYGAGNIKKSFKIIK